MQSSLLIIGAGGHGQVVRETAQAMKAFKQIDFVDDRSLKAIGKLYELEKFKERYDYAFVALGDAKMRKLWFSKLAEIGFNIPCLVHPRAYVAPSAQVDAGTIVLPLAAVQTSALIGRGTIIGVGALIDHDVGIGEYSYIQAGAIIPSYFQIPCMTSLTHMQAAQTLLKIENIK